VLISLSSHSAKGEYSMSTHQIHVFISHSWSYSGHYEKLAEWIFKGGWRVGRASLDFRDYSVPREDPIHNANNDRQLREAIYDKIGRSHVIVIPTGMYAEHSKWIQKEIDGAKFYRKPILAAIHGDRSENHRWSSETLMRL
jgi:hypothetical protein